jgi:hypothetical protein
MESPLKKLISILFIVFLSILFYRLFIIDAENKFEVNTLTISGTSFVSSFEDGRFTPTKSVEIRDGGDIQQINSLSTISFTIRLSNLVQNIRSSVYDLVSVTIQEGEKVDLHAKDFEFKENVKNELGVEFSLFQSIESPTTDRYVFLNNENLSEAFWCRTYEEKPQFCIGRIRVSNTVQATYKLNFRYMQYWPLVHNHLTSYILSRLKNKNT